MSPLRIEALLLDAAGTLLHPAEPVARTYARLARAHGGVRNEAEVKAGFVRAFSGLWQGLRYQGDGRPFWRMVVAEATGVDDPSCFEALYEHFARASAWTLEPGAREALQRLGEAGVRRAVVSNWDLRLRPLLEELGLLGLLDAAIISAEVGLEKPDPRIFHEACRQLGVSPSRVLHIGDHAGQDVEGAEAAGCRALLWIPGRRSLGEVVEEIVGMLSKRGPHAR